MTALITGASSGIGLEYARALARDYHCDLLLVSNQEKELDNVKNELEQAYAIHARTKFMDLADCNAAENLHEYCIAEQINIDILINNAGIFFFNPLTQTSMRRFETMLYLHVVTVAKLTKLFAEDMVARGNGYILNMSSMSAWMAYPGIQTYNSTKAFIYNFSKSLWYELRPKGVHITVMTPGAVDTALFGLAPNLRRLAVNLTVSIPPEKLVKRALKAMFKGKKQCMPGVLNHLATPLLKHTPDWLVNGTYNWVKKFQK